MVEETSSTINKPKGRKIKFIGQGARNPNCSPDFTISLQIKTTRPRAVYLWTVNDVQKWLKRHCSDYYPLYWDKFQQHDITGRALVRINDNTLLRLGIVNSEHRDAIWREIMKLRLKTDIMEIRDLERQNDFFD